MDDKIQKDAVKATKGILKSPIVNGSLEDASPRDVAEAWLVCDLVEATVLA